MCSVRLQLPLVFSVLKVRDKVLKSFFVKGHFMQHFTSVKMKSNFSKIHVLKCLFLVKAITYIHL